MSEHDTKSSQVAKLPDSVKVTQAIAMIDDLRTEVKFLTKLQKEVNQGLRTTLDRVNKLQVMLEAK